MVGEGSKREMGFIEYEYSFTSVAASLGYASFISVPFQFRDKPGVKRDLHCIG